MRCDESRIPNRVTQRFALGSALIGWALRAYLAGITGLGVGKIWLRQRAESSVGSRGAIKFNCVRKTSEKRRISGISTLRLTHQLLSTVNQGFGFCEDNVIGNLRIRVVNLSDANAFLGCFVAAIPKSEDQYLRTG